MKTTSRNIIQSSLWIAFIYISLILVGCGEGLKKKTQIKGIVYDQTTEKPIGGVQIHLFKEWESLEPFGPVYQELVTTATSNEHGVFSVDETLSDRTKYSYLLKADIEELHFFGTGAPHGSFDEPRTHHFIEPGQANHVVIPLIAYGFTEVTVTNNSERNDLSFTLTTHINGIETQTLYSKLNSGESYTSEVIGRVAQGLVDYKWRINGDGIDSVITQNIEIEQGVLNEINFTFEG
jgi:hypothetical protein